MSIKPASRPKIPFNKAMFRWAREWRQRSLQEAAEKLNKSVDVIRAWEDVASDDAPTVNQARTLAEFYDRPFIEFFWDSPPRIAAPQLVPDFRLKKEIGDPRESRELLQFQTWAETHRLNALDLFDLVGEQPPPFPSALKASVSDDADIVAAAARAEIGFPIEEQLGLSHAQKGRLPGLIRHKLENTGIMVLKRTELSRYGVSGFCIAAFPLPVIVFSNEFPAAQAFTLSHEFAHVVLRQSAITGPMSEAGGAPQVRRLEEWCNRFAGAFLIPFEALRTEFELPIRPAAAVGDEILDRLAKRFNVSEHAMLIRLVQKNYVVPEFYWQKKRAEFLAREKEYKPFGRAKYYGTRYRNSQGDLYTGLVLEAWNSGRITNHNAAEFLGIKNFQHLDDIRRGFAAE